MMNPLFLNFLIYLFYFLFIYKRNKLTVYSLLYLYQVIVAFLGYYTFECGIYQKQFGHHNKSELSFTPYLCNFIAFLIVSYPLKGFKINCILTSNYKKQDKVYTLLTNIVCFITIIYSIVLYAFAKRLDGMSFGDIYDANHSGEMITFGIPILDFILTRIYQLINNLIPFVLSYHFAKLAKRECINKSIVIILLIFVPQLLTCIIIAARGRMFFLFSTIIFYIVLFHPKLDTKTKLFMKRISFVFVLLACVYGFLISASRSQNSSTSIIEGIARYFGEPYPNLSISYWNAPDVQHPYGARHFYGIYKFFDTSLDLDAGLGGRHNYWTSYTNVPIYNFKTLYGDLYIEYGVLLPFIILGISTIVYLHLRKSMKGYSKIVIMYLCYHIGVFGLFDYIADIGYRELIIALIIIVVIRLYSKKSYNNK